MIRVNGLTFYRWYLAANFGRKANLPLNIARKAWEAGEDPSEYAGRERSVIEVTS